MTNEMFYEKVINMLPHKLKEPENALKIKKILKIFSRYFNIDRDNNIKYNLLLSLNDIGGIHLDMYGDMFFVYRNDKETDDQFRIRIFEELSLRTVGNNIRDMQNVIDTYVKGGKVRIIENVHGNPAQIALAGRVGTDVFKKAFYFLKNMTPAGVGVFVPIIIYGTWQDVWDLNPKWSDVATDKFIW